MQPSNLNHKKFNLRYFNSLLLICGIMLGIKPAMADIELPSIDNKYVAIQEINPTRDAGYVVGDVLDRTIILTVKKPYQLVKESLPIVGYEHRWKGQISGIELARVTTEETQHSDSVTHTLHLSYQVFTTGKLAKPAALRAEIVKMRNTEKKETLQYRIPSFGFRVSPLSVFGSVKLKEELSPLTPPLLIDSSSQKLYLKVFFGLLSLSLLGLLYILGMQAWLPRMGAPFAKAYRDIRKIPDTAEGLRQAVARMHESLNKTADCSLFTNNIDDFLKKKPAFSPMKQDIEKFFGLSRQVFFETQATQSLGKNSKSWLLQLCRHLRDCERGLKPEVSA